MGIVIIRPRNWKEFQHYKDRRPPWIRLYHKLLDDPDLWEIPAEDYRYLTMLWLIASEHENGDLPPIKRLAWRLRISEQSLTELLARLNQWLSYDASKPIAPPEQVATPEAEAETEQKQRGEASAPLLADDLGSDDEEERTIPDDLPSAPLGNFLLQRLSIPGSYGLAVKFADTVNLLARDEKLPRGSAAKALLDRARARPPENGKWVFWLDDGQWKESAGKDKYAAFLEAGQ